MGTGFGGLRGVLGGGESDRREGIAKYTPHKWFCAGHMTVSVPILNGTQLRVDIETNSKMQALVFSNWY